MSSPLPKEPPPAEHAAVDDGAGGGTGIEVDVAEQRDLGHSRTPSRGKQKSSPVDVDPQSPLLANQVMSPDARRSLVGSPMARRSSAGSPTLVPRSNGRGGRGGTAGRSREHSPARKMSPRRMPTGHFNDDDGDNVSVFAVDEIDQSLHELLDKRNRALLEVRKATAHLESCNLALHCSAKRYNKRNACTLNLNPDVKKVEESFASTIPQWRDVWRTSIADIGKYGVGCQLYFEFLKWLVLIFGGMAVFSTPLMYTCMHGTMVSSPFGALAKTTIGNLGELPPDLNTAMSKKEQIQMLRNRRLVLGDREFDMHRFTTFFGLLDGFCILCFFLWAFWYRKKQLIATVETHDVANTTPNDYSVHISNLPCSIWKNGVRLNLDEYQDLLQSHIDGVLRANVGRYRSEKRAEMLRRKKLEELFLWGGGGGSAGRGGVVVEKCLEKKNRPEEVLRSGVDGEDSPAKLKDRGVGGTASTSSCKEELRAGGKEPILRRGLSNASRSCSSSPTKGAANKSREKQKGPSKSLNKNNPKPNTGPARNVAATTAYYYDGGHTMSSLLEESSMLPDLNYNDPNKDENRHSDGFSDDEEDERFCCMFFRGFRRSLRRLVPVGNSDDLQSESGGRIATTSKNKRRRRSSLDSIRKFLASKNLPGNSRSSSKNSSGRGHDSTHASSASSTHDQQQQDDEHSRHMSQRVANESLDLDKENNWAPVPELQLGEFVLCCRDHGSLNQLNRRIRLGKKRRRLEYQIEERKTTLREQRDLMLLEDQGVNYLEDPRRSDDDDLLRDAPLRGVKLNFDAVGGGTTATRGGRSARTHDHLPPLVTAVDRDLQHDPLLRALQQQLRQNQRQIKRAAHLLKKRVASRKENEVVRAFVIFDHCLDKEIFLWAYKNKHQSDEKEFLGKLAGKSEFLRSLFGLDLRESPLAFEGKLLKVQPAPEPSNLLWENVDGLPDNFFKAFPRRYGASMVSGVLLFLSFVLVFFCEVLPEVGWTDVGGFTLNEAQLVQKLPLRAARKVEVLSTTPPLDFPTSREQGAGALQTEGGRRSSYDEEEGRGAGGASASFGASDVPDLPRFPASARVPEYEVEMELEFPLQLFLPERDGVLGVHGGDEWRDSGAFAHRYRFQDGVLDRAAVVTDAEAHFLQNYLGQEKYAEAGKAVFPWLFSANAKKPDYLLQNDQRDFSAANDIVSPASGGSSTAETSGEQQSVACSSLNLYLEHVFARTKFYQVPEQPLPETEQEALARPLMHASESAIQLELREDSDSTSKKEPVYFSANVTQLVRDFLEEAPVEHQLRFLEIGGEGGGGQAQTHGYGHQYAAEAWSSRQQSACFNETRRRIFYEDVCTTSTSSTLSISGARPSPSTSSGALHQTKRCSEQLPAGFRDLLPGLSFPRISRRVRVRFWKPSEWPFSLYLLRSDANVTNLSVCSADESCAAVTVVPVVDQSTAGERAGAAYYGSAATSAAGTNAGGLCRNGTRTATDSGSSNSSSTLAGAPEQVPSGELKSSCWTRGPPDDDHRNSTSAAAQNQADELENRKQHRVAHPNYFALPAFDCDRDGDKLEYADILLRQSVMPETASQYTSCFCAHQSYMTIASDRNVRSLCHLHMLRLLRQTLGFVFGSFIVVGMNIVLEHCLDAMSMWARPLSITALNNALMWKLFFMEFVNTAIVILLVNTKFDYNGPLLGKGEFSDFEFDWYADVGVGIMITMMINVFSPHVATVVKGWVAKKRRKYLLRNHVKIPEDMTELYLGNQFELATRYSTILTVIFVTLMYSAAIPLLLYMAFFTFTLLYWCDKYTLLRTSRIPPAHDETIAKGVAEALPFAVLVHIGLAIYMYGHDLVFPSPSLAGGDENGLAGGSEDGGNNSNYDSGQLLSSLKTGGHYTDGVRFFRAATIFLFLVLVFVVVVMVLERFAVLLHALAEQLRTAYHPFLERSYPTTTARLDYLFDKVCDVLVFLIGDSAEDDLTEGRYTDQIAGMQKQRFLHTYRPEANPNYANRFHMLDKLRLRTSYMSSCAGGPGGGTRTNRNSGSDEDHQQPIGGPGASSVKMLRPQRSSASLHSVTRGPTTTRPIFHAADEREDEVDEADSLSEESSEGSVKKGPGNKTVKMSPRKHQSPRKPEGGKSRRGGRSPVVKNVIRVPDLGIRIEFKEDI